MSEYDGYLRVATTVGEPTPAPVDGGTPPAQLSDNMVSVLQPHNGALATVGKLDGLGSGEKIYSVRFEGDLGYVVTFNQVDPLYVIDLSNPSQPALAGQVSLSGYSSFLQPLSAGLLLGVGQAVDQTLAPQGLQVEVFNVSDPASPSLVSQQQLGNGASSAAEYDPHALLWWPQSNLLVLPVDDYSSSGPSSAADVWTVSSSGTLDQVGTLAQPGSSESGYPEIERAVIVGNDIYTLSEQGLMVNDIELAVPGRLVALPERLVVIPRPAGARKWSAKWRRAENQAGQAGLAEDLDDPNEASEARARASEAELLAAAAAGEHEALRWLLDDVAPVVYGFLFARVGGDEAAAEDLLQETLLEAVRGARGFPGRVGGFHLVVRNSKAPAGPLLRDRKARRSGARVVTPGRHPRGRRAGRRPGGAPGRSREGSGPPARVAAPGPRTQVPGGDVGRGHRRPGEP